MSELSRVLQEDLKAATVKEITDCIKALNNKIPSHQRLTLSGKKDEIIQRFVNYIHSCVLNERKSLITLIVGIVNDHASRKLQWGVEGDAIKVGCAKVRRAIPGGAPTTIIEQINFVPSPFLKPVHRLTTIKICPVAGQSRQSRSFTFTLTDADRQLLATPNACDDRPPYQIRFYCAKYTGSTDELLVEFPGVCELKVNDTTIVGHSLRCLKGKPGTVNPPDLSIMSKKHAQNNVELVYINSESSFVASAFIVERTPVQTLIETMKKTRVLSKETVLEKIQQTQEDADIIMESETLSTKCPLAFTRIHTPIRSKACNHLQCFDANTFLTMNEQTPTWSCPVCYRRIEDWEDLIVDEYFTEMLLNTPKHIASVRVEPTGHITIIDENPDLADESDEEEEPTPPPPVKKEPEITILLDDDDDDEEEEEQNSNNSRQDDSNIPQTRSNPNSTEPSSQPRKKQKTDVIDLTFDSDDDDEVEQVSPTPQLHQTPTPTPQESSSSKTNNSNDSSTLSDASNNNQTNEYNHNQATTNSFDHSDANSSLYGTADEVNTSSQHSTHETLILPHFATLYNGTAELQ